nr:DNA translocase FtsK 4TM domain-containing protein [Sphingomonas quercus]
MAAGGALVAGTLAVVLALGSYHPSDPSLNTAAAGPVANLLNTPGAWVADLMLSLGGPAAALLLATPIVAGLRLARGNEAGRWGRSLLVLLFAAAFVATAATLLRGGAALTLPAGWGGLIGFAATRSIDAGLALVPDAHAAAIARLALAPALGLIGLALFLWGLGLDAGERAWLLRRQPAEPARRRTRRVVRTAGAPAGVVEEDGEDEDEGAGEAAPTPVRTIIAEPPQRPGKVAAPTGRQGSLDLRDTYVLPGLDLLAPVPESSGPTIDKAALERNARLLETVLEDFNVKGQITEVRPGPVVTMYELEPAPGIKASRVVGLADDIARNMSALSARVAVIPGRTVIGIELPNARREPVLLSELIASSEFDGQSGNLALILGKNIGGSPVVADLAPMPHLLVAGTTGSGKSVGLNAMILSLLYRLTPDQCRMIMIDPKMLELSIYDNIPHLLSPVVTEPAKAIRALKWAVEQMEERYRMMASVGVRGLASFNEKVRAAKAKGQPLGRRVQTGYDADTGQPIYEEEQLDYEPLPQIVVVVDELADLMMTAGKEVEFLIQRLAQKARAAGIHLIMATQRPSVDVITGVIKANLPTRISFAVTSKIDSRTILGEQGAEQLLGKGDMLYMAGGKQLIRVHGPFVSDEEVRAVADHWRTQGTPDYISAVTEEPEDGGYALDGAPPVDDSPDAALYRKAVQVVAESQKASTSYVQRQLRIGYNSAARLIDRMEKEGVVGAADHVGRREVLVDRDGVPA